MMTCTGLEAGAEIVKFTRGNSGDSQDQVRRILVAYRKGDKGTRASIGAVASSLRQQGRFADLLELHRGLGVPAHPMSAPESAALVNAVLSVAFLSDLSEADADLAERRIDVLLRYHDLAQQAEAIANYSLAMLRLRRGRFSDVERLCKTALALMDGPPFLRETALAMVIVARQRLRQPYEDEYRKAADLKPDIEKALLAIRIIAGIGDPERVRADMKEFLADPAGPVQPERTDRLVAAYRDGDPAARMYVGNIAMMLRAQGRVGELLEVHAGVPLPSGPGAAGYARSMMLLECVVLSFPDLPAGVYDLAANRMQQMLTNDPFEGERAALLRAEARHSLALARLRQGRFDEVEPLCADALALTSVSVRDRASVLATIALARRALSQPYEDLLAQAVSLDPHADLVQEASAAVP